MKYSIVIIDDEKIIADNIARKVMECSPVFQVTGVFSDSIEALGFIRSNVPNVVLTDIRMPEMDGLQLAKILSEESPFITTVIISGYSDFSYAKDAIRYGVKDYLLKPLDTDELKRCLNKICTQLDSESADPEVLSVSTGSSSQEIVRLVKEYIQTNYSSPINLMLLAEHFGFSQSYLTKIFIKHTGRTPSKYIKEYRIAVSKQLLKTTDIPIFSISQKVGFSDQFYFCKTFKSVVGMTPSQYRMT